MTNDIVLKYINSEAENCLEKILGLIPSTRRDDAKKLFSDMKNKINTVFASKKFYLRYKTGQVAEFKSVDDIAKNIDYNVITLENYLSRGRGYFEFSGYAISIVPIEEKIIESKFWFRDHTGKVQQLTTMESLAKFSGLGLNSLQIYLRNGKGIAVTKRGYASTSPLEELSFEDAYGLNFHRKYHRWPDANEIPNNPNAKNRY